MDCPSCGTKTVIIHRWSIKEPWVERECREANGGCNLIFTSDS